MSWDFVGALSYWNEMAVLAIGTATLLPIIGTLLVIAAWKYSLWFSLPKLQKLVRGKHCLITGGSQGLGKALALELTKAGAHVTIIARSLPPLEQTLLEMKNVAVSPEQILNFKSCDLTSYDAVCKVTDELVKNGHQPDLVFCSAGSAIPGLMADQLPTKEVNNFTTHAHEWMMDSNYKTSVNTVRALIHSTRSKSKSNKNIAGIAEEQQALLPSRIVFVGSVLSLLSFIGYSAYASSRYAVRGFADSIRSEFSALGIKVHLYLPGNMDSPGFINEMKVKPEITKEIEGSSVLVSSESAAKSLLAGIMKERYYISNDLLGELARVSVNGGAPRANLLIEILALPMLAIIFSVWAFATDMDIKSYYKKKNKNK